MSGLDNKRIAKNSFMLIARMFVTMGISIYSSRIILQALGVVDFGINNVVGGIVSMLSFLNVSMITSVQRFLNYSLGECNYNKVDEIFTTSINIHIILSAVIVLVAETVGLYFLNTSLKIPADRLFSANIVYQLTIVMVVVDVLSISYKALIVANERMGVYAYEAVFKSVAVLVISFIVLNASVDRLVLYVFLLMLVNILVRIFDGWYCSKEFNSRYRLHIDKGVLKELLSFSWWNTLVSGAHFVYTQGTVFLLNVFYGPAVNAAFALSNQVNLYLMTFNSNFVMAVKPQITKTYAGQHLYEMKTLLVYTLKISFIIMGIVSLPFIIRTGYVLDLWLKDVPEYTVEFLKYALLLALIVSFTDPITSAIQATGKIKGYKLAEFFALLLILPLTYFLLLYGIEPYEVYYIRTTVFFIFLFVRLYFLNRQLGFGMWYFSFYVLFRVIMSVCVAYLVLLIINPFLPYNFIGFMLLSFFSLVLNVVIGLYVAFGKYEREKIIPEIRMQLLRFKGKVLK